MSSVSAETGQHVVELGEGGLRIDGVFRPLIAGEFEYWRHHSLYWRKILQVMRESGLEFVSTFVCWDFHEIAPGDFDFTGRTYPSRDLAGFIDAAAEEGLGVFIRVGPIIDAEWPTRGPAADVANLERLHPRYLERTAEYMRALGPVLAPRQVTKGGPITLVSIDNEPYFPYSIGDVSDTSSGGVHVPYDQELVTSRYHQWLESRYDGPAALAQAWGRTGLDFSSVNEPDYRSAALRETLDSFDFITASLRDALVSLRDMCTDAGIDVPIYTNMKQFTMYVDWRKIEEEVDSHGLNLHMPHLWPGDQRLVASWYWRLLRARVRFPWAAEFQGGTSIKPPGLAELFGMFGLEHNRFTSMLSMALGARGLCYYMFVERDDNHWSPISPIGKVRPQMAGFQDAIRVLKELRPDQHLASTGLLWSMDHHRSQVATDFDNWQELFQIWIKMADQKELTPWWETFRQLQEGDWDFDLAPIDQDLGRFRTLIYAGPEFIRREEMERLRAWLDGGGRLIVRTSVPVRSIDGEDLSSLAGELRGRAGVTAKSWGRLDDVLKAVGAEEVVRGSEKGVWTFAYRDEEGWSLFAANIGVDPAPAGVALGAGLQGDLRGRQAEDLLSGAQWTVADIGLWSEIPVLQPNEIRCVRVRSGAV